MSTVRFRFKRSSHASTISNATIQLIQRQWPPWITIILTISTLLLAMSTPTQAATARNVRQVHNTTNPVLIVDLGTLGGQRSEAVAVNAHGQIVGWSETPSGERHAFLWEDNFLTDLGTLGGQQSIPVAINNQGQVIGISTTADGEEHGFFWENGVMTAIEPLGGTYNHPSHVNDQGVVVGRAETEAGEIRAYVWEQESLTNLGTQGGTQSYARRINEQGQIIGQSEDENGANRAFLWEKGQMTTLGTLGGGSSDAGDLNEQGQVVGNALTTNSTQHAFIWTEGVMTDLGTLGGELSYAFRINEAGQVLGQSMYTMESQDQHAFLWEQGQMTDLGTLGGLWSEATALNEAGNVVGWSYTETSDKHAFLWADGVMTDLGTALDGENIATDINDSGWVVGYGSVARETHAMLWRTDLPCDFLATDEVSLRHAIHCVNSAGVGEYTITLTDDIVLTQALPLLTAPFTDRIMIEGNGHILDAQGHGRVLTIDGVAKIDIRNLTLTGGDALSPETEGTTGGAINYYCPYGFDCLLTLENAVVRNNQAEDGGALTYSCDEEARRCGMTLVDTIVAENHATRWGGAIAARVGHLTLTNSTLVSNTAVLGGALKVGSSSATMELIIDRSTISNNQATESGGGLYAGTSDQGPGILVVNSTISGNRARTGGGLYLSEAWDSVQVRMVNSTVTQNRADKGAGVYLFNEASGIDNVSSLTMGNSLIADNQGGAQCVGEIEEGYDFRGQQITSLGHNLDSDGTCLSPTVAQAGDLPGVSAGLGPLDDNGGPTLTHALLPGSQAIDAGDNAICFVRPVNGVDQRGVTRPQGMHCDIGAYEAAVSAGGVQTVYANDFAAEAGAEWSATTLSVTPSGRQFLGEFGAEAVTLSLADLPTHGQVLLAFEFYAIQTWDGNQEFNHDSRIGPDIFAVTVEGGPTLLYSTFSNTEMGTLPGGALGPYPQAYPGSYPGADYPPGTGATEIDTLGYSWDGDAVYTFYYAFSHAGDDLAINFTANGIDESESWGLDNVRVAVSPLTQQLFVSSNSGGDVVGIRFYDEDILAYDLAAGRWNMVFDGSDVGITKDVNAFIFLADGTLLLSFNGSTTVPGLGKVDDSDIVHFMPMQLGPATAGQFAWYLKGADAGLTDDEEDIDALVFDAQGNLVISTIGDIEVGEFEGNDEDLVVWRNDGWHLLLDGSQAGLTTRGEDVKGAWIDPQSQAIYLTTGGDYTVTGLRGDQDDIFICTPTQADAMQPCDFQLFWNGEEFGFGDEAVDGLFVGTLPSMFQVEASSWDWERKSLRAIDFIEEPDADDVELESDEEETIGETMNSSLFLPLVSR